MRLFVTAKILSASTPLWAPEKGRRPTRLVEHEQPDILFKESDFASPSYFASIFTVLHLFAIEREADEETFIGFAKMEWLDIAC